MKAIRRFSVRPVLPERIAALGDLAMNLRWSWHPPIGDLFESIDPQRWQRVRHDPVAMLSATSTADLRRLAEDDGFVARVDNAKAALDRYLNEDRWYQEWAREEDGAGHPSAIAYFSPEFGITAALPQYSGRPGHPRRRPPQVRLGPRCRRSSASVSSTRPATSSRASPGRVAAGDLPGARPGRPAAGPAPRRGRRALRHQPPASGRAGPARPTSGRRRSAGCRCSCSTPTSPATTTRPGSSPSGSTAAAASSASSRSSSSASAASARSGCGRGSPARRARTSTTPTRGTPASSASSGSTSSSPRRG